MAHIAVTKAALEGMKSRKHGMIVNMLSLSGIVGLPSRTLYSSSKFALSGFGKALRAEVKGDGIHVLNIYPSYIQTNVSANAMLGSGETFGKTDSNIGKGMPVAECSLKCMKAMHLKRTEFICADKPVYYTAPIIRLFPTLENMYCNSKYKS